jgi:hypothetical protein
VERVANPSPQQKADHGQMGEHPFASSGAALGLKL